MNVQNRMNYFKVPGVSVTYFDENVIRWSKCYGELERKSGNEVTKNSIFHACSISKMITSICILRLVQEKKLSLSVDVNEYLTAWKIPDSELLKNRKVTLANLLSHQAGFYDIEGSFEPYKKGGYIPKPIDIIRGITAYNKEELHVKYVPETDFSYSDAGYCIIAQVAEDVLGEKISELANRYIFKPLGLERTFFWEIGEESRFLSNIDITNCAVGHDSDGKTVKDKRACYPNIEGAALWTTPSELSAVALDLMASYKGIGGTILNADMAGLMMTPYGNSDFACLGMFYDSSENFYFSQGWGIGMQCKMRLYPEAQKGIVVMTNSELGIEQDRALVGEVISYVCENGKI